MLQVGAMRDNYDFSKAKRNPYAKHLGAGVRADQDGLFVHEGEPTGDLLEAVEESRRRRDHEVASAPVQDRFTEPFPAEPDPERPRS